MSILSKKFLLASAIIAFLMIGLVAPTNVAYADKLKVKGDAGIAVFMNVPLQFDFNNDTTIDLSGFLGVDAYDISKSNIKDAKGFELIMFYVWTGLTLDDPNGVAVPLVIFVDDADAIAPLNSLYAGLVPIIQDPTVNIDVTINHGAKDFTALVTATFASGTVTYNAIEPPVKVKLLNKAQTPAGFEVVSMANGWLAGASGTVTLPNGVTLPLSTGSIPSGVVADKLEITAKN